MVFQGAMNSWNPVYRVGDQIRETLDTHYRGVMNYDQQRAHMEKLFSAVGLPPSMLDRYPHEYSGGMRQRAVIAMALACSPELIIADEPTTALDVIVQDQILKELKRIQQDLGMSIIYISHDIAVIAEVTDSLGVMYAGKLVEYGPDRRGVRPAPPPVRLPPAPIDPLDQRPAPAAGAARGRASRPPRPADRLPVPPALPVRDRAVRPRRAAARGHRRRPPGRLLAPRPGSGARGGAAAMTVTDTTTDRSARIERPAVARDPGPGDEVPDLARPLPLPHRFRPRGRRHQLPDRAGREPGPGRRVRLREVDHRPHAGEAHGADGRQHRVPRRRLRARRGEPARLRGEGVPPPGPDDLPGPVRVDEPAAHDLRHRVGADGGPEDRHRPRARDAASWSSCAWSG